MVRNVRELLEDGPARERMLEGLSRVKAKLRPYSGSENPQHPAERAAHIILAEPKLKAKS